MYNSFISQEKNKAITKMSGKHVIENLSLLFVVIAREHGGRQSTQCTLAREHVKHATREHVST